MPVEEKKEHRAMSLLQDAIYSAVRFMKGLQPWAASKEMFTSFLSSSGLNYSSFF